MLYINHHHIYSLLLNIIRLGVMWPCVEPTKNQYNQTYINKATQIIKMAYNDYNITTLVDCHQVVLSEGSCGEGAALWATDPLIWNLTEPFGPAFNITSPDHISSKDQYHVWVYQYHVMKYLLMNQMNVHY